MVQPTPLSLNLTAIWRNLMAQKRKLKKEGKIIVPAGILPEKHELETANFFASLGKDVEFQLPNRTKGAKTPDVMIDGVLYEMKCPFGSERQTLQRCIRRASKQSNNIIVDLRHTPLKTDYCLGAINREFELRKSIKRLMVITKADTENLIALKRQV
jgi:hypothetical protein